MQIWSLGREDPLEEGMATHSSILAWRIQWTEEPGRLQSIGSHRVGHNWSDLACSHAYSSYLVGVDLSHVVRPWNKPCTVVTGREGARLEFASVSYSKTQSLVFTSSRLCSMRQLDASHPPHGSCNPNVHPHGDCHCHFPLQPHYEPTLKAMKLKDAWILEERLWQT